MKFAAALFLALASIASADDLAPIHPGIPGQVPFWNQNAKQFIWPPSFDVPKTAGAQSYRFIILGSDKKTRSFQADDPTVSLAPVWDDLPPGPTELTIQPEPAGKPTTRAFHRAAPFNGPYGKPLIPYDQSARIALKSVLNESFVKWWLAHHEPDPTYPLNRYPSKINGSILTACAMYATQSPRPTDADDAIKIARNAADFLLSISHAPGSRLEYFPLSYYKAKPTDRENDHFLIFNTPAEAAQGFLDLFDAVHDDKYHRAAINIARTYTKLQSPTGTWPLKIDDRTNQPLADIDFIPSEVIVLYDRLITQYHKTEFDRPENRAVQWMMENPVRTYNWAAQFDDAKLRGPYQNLGKHEACLFAGYLFQHHSHTDQAEEILRWAEDQFVTWEQPPQLKSRFENLDPKNWITPCSTEQYAMYEPISGSSAFMIDAYVRAYQTTKNPIYLAKAQSLANALTEAQQLHNGRYPTRMVAHDLLYWVNSTVNTIKAMQLLARPM